MPAIRKRAPAANPRLVRDYACLDSPSATVGAGFRVRWRVELRGRDAGEEAFEAGLVDALHVRRDRLRES